MDSRHVMETLDELMTERGVPAVILAAIPAAEFVSERLAKWLEEKGHDTGFHRAWKSLGERVRGELSREATGTSVSMRRSFGAGRRLGWSWIGIVTSTTGNDRIAPWGIEHPWNLRRTRRTGPETNSELDQRTG